MTGTAPDALSAMQMIGMLGAGAVTSEQLTAGLLERIRKVDSHLNSFVQVHTESAMEAASASDRRRRAGLALGPLDGVAFSVKDIIDVAGHVTSAGSPHLAAAPASESAAIVRQLQSAGMVLLGKNSCVQLALGAWGTNEHAPVCRNPWSAEDRVPGGSSSGSAVAVAAGLVPFSIGTDTGGSVRVPAAFCGVTGLKLTAGLVDLEGVKPLSTTLDSLGLFARTAQEAAMLLDVLAGAYGEGSDADNAGAAAMPLWDIRIARLSHRVLAGTSPAAALAYERALVELARLGAQVKVLELPRSFEDIAATSSAIMLSEAATDHGALAADESREMDSSVRPRLLAGAKVSAVDYIRAQRARVAWTTEFMEAMDGFHALATPTTPASAARPQEVDHGAPPVRFTRPLNLLGLCGISVPCGQDPAGLPLGLQFGMRPRQERALLRLAGVFQAAVPHHVRRPHL